MNHVGAVIVAAGTSSRMGDLGNKLLLEFQNRSVIARSVERFFEVGISHVVVVVPAQLEEVFKKQVPLGVVMVLGGATRQESVHNGLKALASTCSQVLIHDGARPFVSAELILRVLSGIEQGGAVIPAIDVTDTIARVENGAIEEILKRSELRQVQTPQGFDFATILAAHQWAQANNIAATDDASLVKLMGGRVIAVAGDVNNKKITAPNDLKLFEDAQPEYRVGFGADVHRLGPGRPMILGGVFIPHHVGFIGHSDADIMVHAVIDALLGASGKGDIGEWFPDTDEKYLNANSVELLKQVASALREECFYIANVDITLLLEKPKISQHKAEMASALAVAMGISAKKVNVKATTNEGLGYIGSEEGAICYATVMLMKQAR
ncbi:MAG: 2-C-methyl-D-erythritol 4-phosphate cytidylyltransferase [bacterium]|nr:2-C-methyl-D-erythritol 4-phosphate cytidylyltransferase [bacterium]